MSVGNMRSDLLCDSKMFAVNKTGRISEHMCRWDEATGVNIRVDGWKWTGNVCDQMQESAIDSIVASIVIFIHADGN
jgi:hypothetical protein